MPDEPNMFPNQPNIDEHIAKHQTEESPFTPKIIKVTDVATRLKLLEERYSTLRKKMLLSEQNIIDSEKNHFQEIRLLNDNILNIKRDLKDALEKVSLLSNEIENFASRTDMITLQRYIEFWNPMDFVNRKEVNDFLRKRFNVEKVSTKQDPSKTKKEIESKNKKKENEKNSLQINGQKKNIKTPSIEDAYPDTD